MEMHFAPHLSTLPPDPVIAKALASGILSVDCMGLQCTRNNKALYDAPRRRNGGTKRVKARRRRDMPWETPVPGAGYRNVKFTTKEDYQLTKFLAIQDGTGIRRFSATLYGHLGPKASDEFAWSRHRAAKSWMDRYKNNRVKFEHRVKEYRAQRYELSATKRTELPPRQPTAPPAIKTVRSARKSRIFETPATSPNISVATSAEPAGSPTKDSESTVPVVRALANLKSLLAEEHAETTTRPPPHHRGELAHSSRHFRAEGKSTPPGKPHGIKKRLLPLVLATSTPRKVVDATPDVSLIQEFSPTMAASVSVVAAKEGKVGRARCTSRIPSLRRAQQRQPIPPSHGSVQTQASYSEPARGPAATTAKKPQSTQELLDRASGMASARLPAPASPKPARPPQVSAHNEARAAETESAPHPTAETETAAQQAQTHNALARLARKTKMFSVDAAWAVYARTGSVGRTGEVLEEMESAVRGLELDGVDCEREERSGGGKRKRGDGEQGRAAKRRREV
ncbi:hypothetical protein C8R47DRAFT_1323608 [Mycena vitilis]|nr:hypothetical protein C8R47DRAFT_1323608 [Mycena vitilis]